MLYDDKGNIITQGEHTGARVRGKIRCVDANGNVSNIQNTTIYPGRRFLLESLNHVAPKASQQITLNSILEINQTLSPDDPSDILNRAICLFGVGVGGAGMQFGDVIDAGASNLNMFEQLPLRTVEVTNDLSAEERQQYFMRKRVTIEDKAYFCYYLKKTTPSDIYVKLQNVNYSPKPGDNTPEKDPNDPLSMYPIQVFTTYPVIIGENDIKDYFQARDGHIRQSRFNELGLYYGIPVTVTDPISNQDYIDYIAVEAFSHLTFNNKPMDDKNASFTFTYYLLS
jgi:hypothetical protein